MSIPYDPGFPPEHSDAVSADFRNQFTALKEEIEAKPDDFRVIAFIKTEASANTNTLQSLTQTISNPPTQAQLQAVQNKLNELIAALKTPEA